MSSSRRRNRGHNENPNNIEMGNSNGGGGPGGHGDPDPENNINDAWAELCGGGHSKKWACGGCLFVVVVLFLLIFLPSSFSYVEWNQLAFKKNTLSNTVERSEVFTNGRYFWGVTQEPLTFPSIYQNISYRGNDLSVFAGSEDQNNSAAAGLEFSIECNVYYRLLPENLKEIFNDFGTAYHDRFVDAIKASIKNTAPEFGVDDYVENRQTISERMREEINNDIKKLNIQIEPHHLMLFRVNFPDRVLNKFEATVMKDLEIDKSILNRDVEIYKKGTEKQVSEIQANITVVNETADAKALAITETATAKAEAISLEAEAKAEAIILNAQAESIRIHEEALGVGLNNMMEQLGIDSLETRRKLFQILIIMDNPGSEKIIIGDENTLLNIG